jgi:hypothetical protein
MVALGAGNLLGVSETFEWTPGASSDKEITITPGTHGSISGSITGAPEQGVEIVATNTSLPEGKATAEFQATPSGGKYQFPNLPPGDYLILASGGSYSASALNIDLHANENRRVDLQPMQTASVTGVVVIGSEVAAGAEALLISQTDPNFKQRREKVNAQGSFVFNDVLPDSYIVEASITNAQGELKASRSVMVNREGAPAPVRIDLLPPKMMSIVIPPEANIPVGADVTLLNLETRETVRGTWNNNMFDAPVIPGDYEIWNGDAVIGNIAIDAQGKTTFGKKESK